MKKKLCDRINGGGGCGGVTAATIVVNSKYMYTIHEHFFGLIPQYFTMTE